MSNPARANASCTLFQKMAKLSEYTLMRIIFRVSALARSLRYQFTAVVFPYPMGATTVVMAQREMGRRLSCSRSDM